MQLTSDIIINGLNKDYQSLFISVLIWGVVFLVMGIAAFINFKKDQNSSRKKGTIIGILIVLVLIGFPLFKSFLTCNAIKHSLNNNSWSVETDTILRTKSSTDDDGDTSYYAYLKKYGKLSVGRSNYYDLSSGKTVYVVVVKGVLGGTYATSPIYPTGRYTYNQK